MKRLLVLMVAVLLAVLTQANAQKGKTFSDVGNNFQIQGPKNWSVLDLHDTADIEAGNLQKETYLLILSEQKADLYGWNLTKHSMLTLGNFLASLDFPEVAGPTQLVINGNPAVQFKINGAAQGLNITYLHTTVESDGYFNQILAWTLESRFEENKGALDKAISSFQETQ